jgi:hypothetical protein
MVLKMDWAALEQHQELVHAILAELLAFRLNGLISNWPRDDSGQFRVSYRGPTGNAT